MITINKNKVEEFKKNVIKLQLHLKGVKKAKVERDKAMLAELTELQDNPIFIKGLDEVTYDDPTLNVCAQLENLINNFGFNAVVKVDKDKVSKPNWFNYNVRFSDGSFLYFLICFNYGTETGLSIRHDELDESFEILKGLTKRLECAKADLMFKDFYTSVSVYDNEMEVLSKINSKYKIIGYDKK